MDRSGDTIVPLFRITARRKREKTYFHHSHHSCTHGLEVFERPQRLRRQQYIGSEQAPRRSGPGEPDTFWKGLASKSVKQEGCRFLSLARKASSFPQISFVPCIHYVYLDLPNFYETKTALKIKLLPRQYDPVYFSVIVL